MKISLNWLQDYLDISDFSVEQISTALTSIGLEVEHIATTSSLPETIVVGKVISAEKHPNADTLRTCKVDIGAKDILDIVCGAPNAREGIYVAVATVGSTLPGDFKIKEAKIRGCLSQGMLCSSKELGLGDDHDGIIEMKEFKLGTPFVKAMGLGDTILTLNITPNRGDCLSYIGVGRDLGAKLGRSVKLPANSVSTSTNRKKCEVNILSDDSCGRFVALHVENVPAQTASPKWLQKRLESNGMRPINIVVDATNYVMLECNQPIHAYDERELSDSIINVRQSKDGETLITLDGVTQTLVAGDILICDAQKPVGLAGVMGGQNSEIKKDTKNIIIEVAYFNPAAIRKTAKRLALHTEASHRFERSVDIDNVRFVAQRVVALIEQCCKELNLAMPQASSEITDIYPKKKTPSMITVRTSFVKETLGLLKFDMNTAKAFLNTMGIRNVDHKEERYVFEIPSWRPDLERECDLVEEIARMIGFDQIPTELPEMNIKPSHEDALIGFVDKLKVAAANAGFCETISFPFHAKTDFEKCNLEVAHPFFPKVKLANAINDQESYLTTTLTIGLLKALQRNRAHGQAGAKLFEVGRGYFDFKTQPIDYKNFNLWAELTKKGRFLPFKVREDNTRTTERVWLGLISDSPFTQKSWNQTEQDTTFFHLKTALQNILRTLGIVSGIQLDAVQPHEIPWMHPRATAKILLNGKFAGYMGELHPKTTQAFDFTETPCIIECDAEALLDATAKTNAISTQSFPFPPSSRDVAWLTAKATTHSDFEKSILSFKDKKYLQRFELFDLYEGANIPADKKSMAYRFEFQSPEKTLTDEQVDQEMQALLTWVNSKIGAEART